MSKFLDGIKLGLGFIFVIGLLFGLVYAIGFHTAEEILGGTFTGNFIFEDNVTFNGSVKGISTTSKLENLSITCNLENEGTLKYATGLVKVCDGTNWIEVGGTIPSKGNDENTLLLLHFDGSWYDNSQRHHTLSANNGAINNGEGKFGTGAYFDGTNDYISIPDSADWVLDSDFTIDFWIKPINTGAIFSQWQNAGGSNRANYLTTNNAFYKGYDGNNNEIFFDGTDLTSNTWTHIAIVKDNNGAKLYINGIFNIEDTEINGNPNDSTMPFIIGAYTGGSEYLNGYIDEFRISNVARWTEDFTPPTEPYS